MPNPSLRKALAGGNRVLTTFVMIPRVEIVEMLGLAGFDAVIIDLEHGPIGIAELPPLAAAASGAGMQAIVRLADGSPATIGKVLDTGVDAVMVPHVSSRAAAEAAVSAARFPPEGERSLNPYVRGNGYDASDRHSLAGINERAAVVTMVEGDAGVRNLDDILAVDGLDGIFVGPVDLSDALGHPGQPEHPAVEERIAGIVQVAADQNVATGLYAPSTTAASRWLDRGVSLVAVSADAAMILESFRSARGAFER